MIISRIKGGIGNQLFIYSASKRLALKNNTSLVLDHLSGFTYDKNYQRHYQLDHFNIPYRKATNFERLEPLSRFRRYFKRAWNKNLPMDQRNYIFEKGIDFEKKLLNSHIKGNVYLEGYFQTENFFKDIECQIKKDLCINPPSDYENLNMLKKIKNKISIAIHFRFFDSAIVSSNKKLEKTPNTPIDYYKRAIMKMKENIPNAHYFIFSDQPQKINNYLPLDNNQMTIIDHNRGDTMAYADLWLMSHCQHFIIAKSTFSWWGAWLSNNKKKIIIAPKIDVHQNNFWCNDSLLPKEWVKI